MTDMRLFIALRPGPASRTALIAMMGGVAGARWQNDDQLHLTLAFLDEVDEGQAQALAAALSAISSPPIDLTLAGTGEFDRKGVVHSLWVGARPADALSALAAKVTQAARRAGLSPEARAFVPHVTIARLNRGCGSTAPFHAANGDCSIGPERVDHFALVESVMGSGGSQYFALSRYPLH